MRTFLLAFAIFLLGCQLLPAATPADPEAPGADVGVWLAKAAAAQKSVPTETTCRARGGRWAPQGMSQVPACELPTPDAGKACNSDSQCAMMCTPDKRDDENARSGRCAPTYQSFGCLQGMTNGKPGVTMCID